MESTSMGIEWIRSRLVNFDHFSSLGLDDFEIDRSNSTNNIGEFLAIVHGLAFLKQNKSDRIIYTDSRTAMSWVRKKNCNTKLVKTEKNKDVFELIERAVEWLKNNSYATIIVKWETKAWGEIPADFGRK